MVGVIGTVTTPLNCRPWTSAGAHEIPTPAATIASNTSSFSLSSTTFGSNPALIQRVLMKKTGCHVYYLHDRERDLIQITRSGADAANAAQVCSTRWEATRSAKPGAITRSVEPASYCGDSDSIGVTTDQSSGGSASRR